METLSVGTVLRWRGPSPGRKPLGVVIAPPSGEADLADTVYVLMMGPEATFDLEVFASRPGSGRDAAELVLERMAVVDTCEPALLEGLGRIGANWWHINAHLNGAHDEVEDPEC